MKRSWLIGAALVLSLSAVACSDDDDTTITSKPDAGHPADGSVPVTPIADGGIDAAVPGLDSGTDGSVAHDSGLLPDGAVR